jgi:hypothetical protein
MKPLLLLLFAFPFHLFSQAYEPFGTRSKSLANSSICFADVWAFYNNPGALAKMEQFSVGLGYENRFLLKEFQMQGLAIVLPTKKGVFSVGATYQGNEALTTTKVGFGYGLKLAEKFYAGLQLNYHRISLGNFYGATNFVTAEAGFLAILSPKWQMGCSVYNVGRTRILANQDERLSTVFRIGTTYQFSEHVTSALEVEKTIEDAANLKIGLEYTLKKRFFMRGGLATSPLQLSFGFGFKSKHIQLDFGSAYNQWLGWSPQFSITYQAK